MRATNPGERDFPVDNSGGLPFLHPQIVSAAIAGGGADAQMPTPKFFDDASEPGTVQTWGRRHVGPCGRDRCEPSTYGEVGLSLDLLRSAARQRGSEVALSMSRHGLATRPDSGWHPGDCETSSTTGKTSTARSPTTSWRPQPSAFADDCRDRAGHHLAEAAATTLQIEQV